MLQGSLLCSGALGKTIQKFQKRYDTDKKVLQPLWIYKRSLASPKLRTSWAISKWRGNCFPSRQHVCRPCSAISGAGSRSHSIMPLESLFIDSCFCYTFSKIVTFCTGHASIKSDRYACDYCFTVWNEPSTYNFIYVQQESCVDHRTAENIQKAKFETCQ